MSNQASAPVNQAPSSPNQPRTIDAVNASLPRRYAAERRFRYLGVVAVLLGLSFVAILFADIVSKGYTAFRQTYIQLPITFSEALIDPEGTRDPNRIAKANYLKLAQDSLLAQFPEVKARREKRALYSLLSPGVPQQLEQLVMADPGLIGSTRELSVLANDDIDMYIKGRSTEVDEEHGLGIASPTGTTGEIRILSTVNDFAVVLDDVKDFLDHEARNAERALARLERNLAEIEAEIAKDRSQMETAGAPRESQTEFIQAASKRLEARRTSLASELELKRGQTRDLRIRAEAPGGNERLTGDMPSYLVAINGDLVEVGETNQIFTNPRHKLTEDYITGRFG